MNKSVNVNYQGILTNLKEKIRVARVRTITTVNYELLKLYWEIGRTILEMQKEQGWGAKIIDTLATDLKTEFPDFKGLSSRNLKYMRTFADTYPAFPIVQPLAAQLEEIENQHSEFVQPLAAQIPWTHHIVILNKVKTDVQRHFYIQETIKGGWSKNILTLNIENRLYERQGKALSNFSNTLPAIDSDLANETFKNPYIFDLLSLSTEMKERDIEKALVKHLKGFMLELGRGFAFVNNQYNLKIDEQDFFLDLLFYNYHLHCFVVFELKVGDFKPEYAGKLNFYINALDAQVKGKDDKPTIGVLLCKTPNETVVKYALQNIDAPMGVAEYELKLTLPKELKTEMPSIDELEAEIDKEYEELKSPIDKKRDRIKELVKGLKNEPIREIRSEAICMSIFENVLLVLKNKIANSLVDEIKLFDKSTWGYGIDNIIPENEDTARLELQKRKEVGQFRLELRLSGFKPAGTRTFNIWSTIYIELRDYYYIIQRNAAPNNQWYQNVYPLLPIGKDIEIINEKFCDEIYEDIRNRLESIRSL